MAFTDAEQEAWLREIYAPTAVRKKAYDLSAEDFQRYLASQKVCQAAHKAAKAKTLREFWETSENAIYLLATLRVCANRLSGNPPWYDIADLAMKCFNITKADPHDDLGYLNPDGCILTPGRVSDEFMSQAMYCWGKRNIVVPGQPLSLELLLPTPARAARVKEIRELHRRCCDLLRGSKILTF